MASQSSSTLYPYKPPRQHSLFVSALALPWLYLKALVVPVPKTYAREGERAKWGLVWIQVFFLMLIPAILGFIKVLYSSNPDIRALARSRAVYDILTSLSIGTSTVTTLFQVILAPVFFFVTLTIQYVLAKIFRGHGRYLTQAYSMLLYYVPLVLISSIVSALFIIFRVMSFRYFLPLINILLFVYGMWLNTVMLAGVHTMIRSKAAVIVLLYYLLWVLIIVAALSISAQFLMQWIHSLNTQ